MNDPFAQALLRETQQESKLVMNPGDTLVADVVVETHPVLNNHILVSGVDATGVTFEQWLTHVCGVVIRAGDKVLLQRPADIDQPLVTAVVESSQRGATTSRAIGEALQMQADEVLRINDHHGKPLLEVFSGESGPELKLHHELSELDVEGSFKLKADSLELNARQGEMTLAASGDIKVDGEMIKLN